MKEIKAIIHSFMLGDVCDALEKIEGLPGLTMSDVLGYGRSRAADVEDPHRQAGRAFAKKTKLEIVVNDEMAQRVVEAIAKAAHTGRPGDGKVFVYEVEEVVRIRSGERGTQAV